MSSKTILSTVAVVGLALFVTPARAQTTWYVDDDAATGGDGLTWETANRYLQDAMAVASAGDEIRVAGGTYKPDQDEAGNVVPGDREATFALVSGVEIYGGYLGCPGGTCGSNPDERDIEEYETILSGDLLGDDDPDGVGPPNSSTCCTWASGLPGCDEPTCEALVCAVMPSCCDTEWDLYCGLEAKRVCCNTCGITNTTHCDNSHHVVTGSGTNATAVLDGFTITAGNADGVPEVDRHGGGMRNHAGSPTLLDCVFVRNEAAVNGGGMYNAAGSAPTLRECTFTDNFAKATGFPSNERGGGGVYSIQGSLTLNDCVFSDNRATLWNFGGGAGGGLHATDSDILLRRCTFTGSQCYCNGGAIQTEANSVVIKDCVFDGNSAHQSGGGLSVGANEGIVARCTFLGNTAFDGAGMATFTIGPDTVVIDQCVFVANHASGAGGGLYNEESSPTVTNCWFVGNWTDTRGGGGLYDRKLMTDHRTKLTNCTFNGNSAGRDGGAVLNSRSRVTLTNCTIFGNWAVGDGGGLMADWCTSSGDDLMLENCIVWGNTAKDGSETGESAQIAFDEGCTPAVNYSDIQGWTGQLGGTGNIGDDPLFVDPDGSDNIAGNTDDDLRLTVVSPCIDTADDSVCPEVDQRGVSRPVDGDGDVVAVCDMGVFEYIDCNESYKDDGVDISDGTSSDCNNNGVPDECESGCETASEEGVGDGETVVLNPGGGSGDPTEEALVEFTNESGSGGAWIEVNETIDEVHPDSGGFGALGTTLLIETNLDDGEFFLTLTIPFDAEALDGADPMSVDLVYYDATDECWVLAVAGNTQPSPGYEPDPIGDRFAVEDTTPPTLSEDLGDYGVFWNPTTLTGFAWANVDHSTGFAAAVWLCPVLNPPQADALGAKNRYISFLPDNPGQQTAIRVRLVDLPTPFDAYNGETMWVGEPFEVTELAGSSEPTPAPTFMAARLCSEAFYTDWNAHDTVHVFDNEVVPAAVYEVQGIHEVCDESAERSYSYPLTITTSRWGDIVGDCETIPCTPPNGVVDFIDIAALVDKFKNLPGAPIKARTDLAGDVPDRIIDFVDISNDVDAFKSKPYPYGGPDLAPCP